MAIIKCEECGVDISSEEKSCPECGCPVEIEPQDQLGEALEEELEEDLEEEFNRSEEKINSEEEIQIDDQGEEEFFVTCSECGQEFPERADACPKCGYPNDIGDQRSNKEGNFWLDEVITPTVKEGKSFVKEELIPAFDESVNRTKKAIEKSLKAEELKNANNLENRLNSTFARRDIGNTKVKFCPQCGTEIKEQINFCRACGFQLSDVYKIQNKAAKNNLDKGRLSLKSVIFLNNPTLNFLIFIALIVLSLTGISIYPILLLCTILLLAFNYLNQSGKN